VCILCALVPMCKHEDAMICCSELCLYAFGVRARIGAGRHPAVLPAATLSASRVVGPGHGPCALPSHGSLAGGSVAAAYARMAAGCCLEVCRVRPCGGGRLWRSWCRGASRGVRLGARQWSVERPSDLHAALCSVWICTHTICVVCSLWCACWGPPDDAFCTVLHVRVMLYLVAARTDQQSVVVSPEGEPDASALSPSSSIVVLDSTTSHYLPADVIRHFESRRLADLPLHQARSEYRAWISRLMGELGGSRGRRGKCSWHVLPMRQLPTLSGKDFKGGGNLCEGPVVEQRRLCGHVTPR
jgi:hypothetical protein